MWILDLGFRLNRISWLKRLAFVCCLIVPAKQLLATPWRLSERLQKYVSEELLYKYYPEIQSAEDLQNLLKSLSHQQPLLNLEANLVDGVWVLDGEEAEYVHDISIDLITGKLDAALDVVRQKYSGRVDSLAIRRSVINSIQEILANAGFTNAGIRFQAKRDDDGVSYVIEIDEGEGCFISSISMPFSLPSKIRFDVDRGDVCDRDTASSAVDKLEDELRKDGYREASLQFHGFQYTRDKKFGVLVIKGRLGKRIIYKVRDRSSFFILDKLFSDEDEPLTDLNVASPDIMRTELQKYYLSKGYEDVVIKGPDLSFQGQDTVEYTFQVDQGTQFILSSIQFEGNEVFSRKELLNNMGLFNLWGTSVPYNREEINAGIERLIQLYHTKGYWDVTINSPRIMRDKVAASVSASIQVIEGKPRILEALTFEGNKVFSREDLLEDIQIAFQTEVDKSLLISYEEKIKERYIKLGYNYVDVQIKVQSREELRDLPTTVIVKIVEGERVKFGQVSVVGLVKTDPDVVQRELQFESGDWYNPEAMAKSRASLVNLGIFSSVQIIPADRIAYLDKENILDIVVEVIEGKFGNVSFGPGYSLLKGMRYVGEVSYNNIRGTGRQVSLKVGVSQEKNQQAISNPNENVGKQLLGRSVGMGYVEPYVFRLPWHGRVGFVHSATADAVWQINDTLEISLTHKLKEYLVGGTFTPFYNIQLSRNEGSLQQKEALIATGETRVARVGMRFKWDKRLPVSWPVEGFLTNIETSWARYPFGSEFRYFKWDFSFSYYQYLFWDITWANGISLASYENIARNSSSASAVLPATDRLYAGGPNRVRGYNVQLGPYVTLPNGTKNVFFGSKLLVLKSELRKKIWEYVGMSAFVDCGNTFLSDNQIAAFNRSQEKNEKPNRLQMQDNFGYNFEDVLSDPEILRTKNYISSGVALNLITPIGPLYGSIAWPVREPKSPDCQADSSKCYSRKQSGKAWWARASFDLIVGTEF